MDQPIAEAPPGCLIVLIAQSAAMADDVRVRLAHREIDGELDVRESPALFAARFLADELLEGLAGALAAGYSVPLDVAVIGYCADTDGVLQLTSLLPDGRPRVQVHPLADVAAMPVEARSRAGEPRKWTNHAECAGAAPAAEALAETYRLVSAWLVGLYRARPPVVIHCSCGEGLDDEYARIARSFEALTTAHGPARLVHIDFATSDPFPEVGAVSRNGWSIAELWNALFEFALSPKFDSTTHDGGRFSPTIRQLWTQKMGNSHEEWEDACATDAARGLAVVADGASSGIYCRLWADQLTRSFIAERPDVYDAIALENWVHELRCDWRAAIKYPTLSWTKQRKVDETGAAATMLGLEVGPLDGDGNRPWRAWAVGDASLFWIRAGELLATFPVVSAGQFGSTPLLVRSNPGYRTLTLAAGGVCRAGDRFLLATDAIAAGFFRSLGSSPGPDWSTFETIGEDVWRKDQDSLRTANQMVNDDCTLVVLIIAGSDETREETSYAPD